MRWGDAAAAVTISSDGREFRRVLGHYPTGVTVVTATCPGGPEGLTIGSFTSVSLDPPLVSFCPGHDSDSWARMRDCRQLLCERAGLTIRPTCPARLPAGPVTPLQGRPDALRVEATGAPVIEGCLAWIDCRVETVHYRWRP